MSVSSQLSPSSHASLLPLAFAIAAALAGAQPLAARADAATGDDLDKVVVTATRTAVTTDATLAPVEVIDRESIARSQASTLAELLRGRAGINLSNQGGTGKLTTVFLRGAESDHVLVLLDGVRVGSATSGLASFQDLPIAMIDRIEIVRGPRSSLYGSDAIGGVIQIFTRRETGDANFHFHLGAGSNGRREGGVGVGVGGERGWFGIDAGMLRTDGINACDGIADVVNGIFAGCFTTEPDRDGYRQHAFSARGGLKFGDDVTLDAHALRVSGHNEYDGSFVNSSDIQQLIVGTKLDWRAGDRVNVQVGLGHNKDASDNFLDGVANGDFASRRDSANVQADVTLAEGHLLTVGADWLRDRIESSTNYDEKRRANRAGFVQYQGRLGANDLQLAVRRDDNDQFGGKTTGTAAWGVGFAEDWRVTASYGTGFKAPTFNELYFPFFGNPALRPESSRTAEVGVAWRGDNTSVRLDAFATEVDDLIAYDAALFLPNNIEEARLRGAELRVDSTVFGWQLGASASWLDTENRSNGFNRGNELPRRARESARLELDRAFGDFRVGLTGAAEGSRYDDVANTRELGGYATLDLRAEYTLARDWTLQARVGNVFDRDYETAAYYNQPGREYFVTVRYRSGR